MKIAFAILFTWQLVVVIYQFSESLRRATGGFAFYLCGLLPSWRMFGPRPVDGDFLLFYRVRAGAAGDFSAWRPLPMPAKAYWLPSIFFHPQALRVKVMRDLCAEVNESRSPQDPLYQLLLRWILTRVTQLEPEGSGHQLQFRISWRTPATLHPLFESHVHPI